ncbi:MAG TPA: TaqI-like C-terminal specificity domain-containing protein [Saprospiraceae bacterium]|nr:TaqI-like C-terminal specificity domain-containing protein [Saprospiraceae bacterium]
MSLKLLPTTPKKSLNAAFLKVRPLRSEIDAFKVNLINLLDKVDESEREENQKIHVRDFLLNTYYKGKNEINTKGTIDLVIHTENNNKSKVGVIIEAKRPSNKAEWITADKANGKALQEAVLYYMRERVEENNIDIKHLVLTNIYEWYIIDAAYFDKLFYQNKKFVKDYQAWSTGQKVSGDTALFYNDIAKPMIESLEEEIPCTYFDLRTYEKELRNKDTTDDKKLIELQKLLSEFHLLKVPFANDSNKLDKRFYSELLHIIGLTEIKDGGKKLIGRHKEGERMMGSILEDTIMQLDARDKLDRVKNASQYGSTRDERLFNISLELTITWINRILFLKLLEGQLLSYHRGDKAYLFLNHNTIREFDQLDALFFQVLAKRFEDRNEHVSKMFHHVPYLNSSLFEPTELEHDTLFISNLSDDKTIPIHGQAVLKAQNGAKRSGDLSTLEYLFAFLDAYDFSGEGSEDIQEDNKPLINASVLGLIFEKINGYKDGSFFTPGFITMYMCRETIRRAVVQKFNENKGWQCETIDQLYDKIEDRKEANALINDIKICDPAVGSGHFLVSALNEMIAIKSDLKVLLDREGKRLKEYEVEVVNDELIVKDIDGELYQYYPHNKESQRVQEALFYEKQTIIENCLFGVDINANSVKICRLRLWIELLKNAYYKNKTELETLPNIDINIKCGNSLVSRFTIDADMKDVLKKAKKWNIQTYKLAVNGYRNAKTKEEKREFESLIEQIKTDFKSEVDKPFMKKISEARGKAEKLAMEITNLTAFGQKIDASLKKNLEVATATLTKLEAEREDILQNKIFENAFEWRFEFPEVLNDEGDFVGFDVVIGNPPYISLSKDKEQSEYFSKMNYQTYSKGADIYCLFYELGGNILKPLGYITYITSNSWLRAIYGELLKKHFIDNLQPIALMNIEDVQIFEEATVESNIITLKRFSDSKSFPVVNLSKDYILGDSLTEYFYKHKFEFTPSSTSEWFIGNQSNGMLKSKIENGSKLLKEFNIDINRGFLTGLNEAFIINESKKNELIKKDSRNNDIIKPILRGRDLKKYYYTFENVYLINSHNGIKSIGLKRIDSEVEYPTIYEHLKSFSPKIEIRFDKGDHWSNLRNCAYLKDFEKEKIIWGEISDKPKFAYDDNKYFAEATTFLMTGEKLKFLLAILNSKVSEWYFNLIGTTTGMGTNRWKKYKIELLPIKVPSAEQENEIEKIVNKILVIKKQSPTADTTNLESQIDHLVYELYGLTEEEIDIVEGRK